MEYNYLAILDYDCEGRVIIIHLTEQDKQNLDRSETETDFIDEFVADKYNLSSSSYNYLFMEKLFVVNDTGISL